MLKTFFLFISVFLATNVYAQDTNNVIKLSLDKAIEISLQYNPEIISASKEIEASVGKVLQAGRIQNAELSFEVNEIPNIYEFGNAGELDINFNQAIELFGKRGNKIQTAENQKRIAELNYERVKKLITAQVKKIYYSGLLANQIVESIESNINLLNDFLAQVTDRYQAGTSSYLDVIRAKVELAGLKNELFEAKKNYQQVIAQLNILLGNNYGTGFKFTDSLSY